MYIPDIPDNSLKKEFIEIMEITKKLESIKKYEFNPPATNVEIDALEEHLKYTLPEEYKDFLKFSNGMTLNGFTAEFFSTKEVIDFYDREKADSFPSDYIVLAFLIGDGEVLCISSKTGKFIRYYGGEETEFNTFKDALVNIIDHIKVIEEDYLLED
ncbi:MAG: SMI1/KNR4 family protein [Ruminococcus sp.]|uniref:SMI1/KNR4 family protein n=1 Tax=Ruminococcus sp. TaxID=41978 RepID=UPI0025F69912|nr:SMI1/KNR4 family protein [Ruminococcus sp.]MCR5600012.1 SMI1/KNR4 family protein [Ruminococcus sp.]